MTRKSKARGHLSYQGREALHGWLFILPWLVGFALFFAYPMGQSLQFSLSKLAVLPQGGYKTRFVGLENYVYAFITDAKFTKDLLSTVQDMLFSVPVIVMVSLLLALLLNQKFHMRTVARAIFFLPVIIASGVIMNIIREDIFAKTMRTGAEALNVFQSQGLKLALEKMSLPPAMIAYLAEIVSRIFDLLWKCGIQMLLFLAGLQSISGSLYEAAEVEGATAWEKFWRITVPMISPIILLCVVYSVIDSFTDYSNAMMQLIYNTGIVQLRYDYGTAIAWIFSAIVLAMVGLVAAVMSRFVFYQVD